MDELSASRCFGHARPTASTAFPRGCLRLQHFLAVETSARSAATPPARAAEAEIIGSASSRRRWEPDNRRTRRSSSPTAGALEMRRHRPRIARKRPRSIDHAPQVLTFGTTWHNVRPGARLPSHVGATSAGHNARPEGIRHATRVDIRVRPDRRHCLVNLSLSWFRHPGRTERIPSGRGRVAW